MEIICGGAVGFALSVLFWIVWARKHLPTQEEMDNKKGQ